MNLVGLALVLAGALDRADPIAAFAGRTFGRIPIDGRTKWVALTFDDGPLPSSTEIILGELKKRDWKATFFVVGQFVRRYPDLARRIVAEGHQIENHSWSHPYHGLTPAMAREEVDRTSELIAKVTGVRPRLFRPPGAMLQNGMAAYAKTRGYGIAIWSATSADTSHRVRSDQIVSNVLAGVRPGAIILLHDGGGNLVAKHKAWPLLLDAIEKKGYRSVRISDLMRISTRRR